MHTRLFRAPLAALLILSGCSTATPPAATTVTTTPTAPGAGTIANLQPFTDPTGTVATYTSAGVLDLSLSFFQPLGTNGRTCATCHQPSQGMSITPTATLALFNATRGTDALFAAIDGGNCPTAITGDAATHSLLLQNGLIRIPITLPATREFTITAAQDPYGCAITTTAGQTVVSTYRRPLPTSGLPFLSSVMWDSRETIAPLTSSATFNAALTTNFTQQLIDAIATHAQGTATPTSAQIASMLATEQGLFTAQLTDATAGSLSAAGATGGPTALAGQAYYPGTNDAFGGDPTGKLFDPVAFKLFAAWGGSANAQQASIARGQAIFNTTPINITAVRGINDNTALGSPNNLRGTCTTCHDAPNLGHHSLPLAMDTGATRLAASETDPRILAGLGPLAAPSLPIYVITGCKDAAARPVTYTTTDPGRALVTGLCADVNRVKVPMLRGLAARAPFFHNGSAANLAQLVNFYDARFAIGLPPNQKADLINFLNAL